MRFVAAASFSAAISEEHSSLFLWGSGPFGEFLTPHRVKKIKQEVATLSLGQNFGVALGVEGALYSWGKNSFGELGSGDYMTRTTPMQMTQLNASKVT